MVEEIETANEEGISEGLVWSAKEGGHFVDCIESGK